MRELASGNLRKMVVSPSAPVNYQLKLSEQMIELNPYLGKQLCLEYQGEIHCVQCGRKTNKSFQQGYCFHCMRRLAECDYCVIHPEKCHHGQEGLGECPSDDWAHAHCTQSHIVYLANSTGIKVGITRESQLPIRWIDQGASQAIPIFRVANRYQSGVIEVCLKQFVQDRTDWRRLLRSEAMPIDLIAARDELLAQAQSTLSVVLAQFPATDIALMPAAKPLALSYPVVAYPEKIKALSFDKTTSVSGILQGIKGQYLIFDRGVINMRKFAGYLITAYSIIENSICGQS